jgi:uncharacterized protein with HEPN domain
VSSRDAPRRLREIIENIGRIQRYIADMDADTYEKDDKTQNAVQRCLERMSEAARKIGPVLDDKYPEVEFPKLRRLGSVLRHDYDQVDIDLVWKTLHTRLDRLDAACRAELKTRRSKRS